VSRSSAAIAAQSSEEISGCIVGICDGGASKATPAQAPRGGATPTHFARHEQSGELGKTDAAALIDAGPVDARAVPRQ